MHDLLTEPLLPATADGHELRLSLPGVLARLGNSDIDSFPGLAAHQRQGWFHFLVQLGAIALYRGGLADPPGDETVWRTLLRDLTPERSEAAWSLMVDDPVLPAFMQPPTTPAFFAKMKPAAATPDEIDLLQTAKNHDVKAARMGGAAPHLWTYALIALQTMQGFSGRGNYGIARMNGGFSSRVLVELVPSMGWGERFRRGVAVALGERSTILKRGPYFAEDGPALLWLAPWDAEESLSLASPDPFFVEICRRIRLVQSAEGHIAAVGRPSQVPRVAAKDARGVLEDPWTPVRTAKGEPAALTVGPRGFDYRRIVEILFDGAFDLPAALKPRRGDSGEMLLHLAVLVRGQGKTEGLHDRVVAVGPKLRGGLFGRAARETLNVLAGDMIEQVDRVAKRPLRIGLLTLLQAPEPGADVDFQDDRVRPWLDRFDREVDAVFFGHLGAIHEKDDEVARDAARAKWNEALRALARRIFADALARLSPPGARREQARAMADNTFRTQLRRVLPELDRPEGAAA